MMEEKPLTEKEVEKERLKIEERKQELRLVIKEFLDLMSKDQVLDVLYGVEEEVDQENDAIVSNFLFGVQKSISKYRRRVVIKICFSWIRNILFAGMIAFLLYQVVKGLVQ